MSLFSDHVLAARRRLAEGYAELKARHRAGCSGVGVSTRLADLRDEVVLRLFAAAIDDLAPRGTDVPQSHVALVAHGGYGRRSAAPHSDVDLMILHDARAGNWIASLAERLWRDLVDAGLSVGHSIRTPDEAAALAYREATVVTSLVEARLLAGGETILADFSRLLRRHLCRQPHKLMTAMVNDRAKEQERYGETVYLLEPNVKRSTGALRDLHLLRWIGLVRYGTPEPRELQSLGVLSDEDFVALAQANEFLLRLRNELHFHAGRVADVLDRAEQIRIAELFGYEATAGQLPVERFMQQYFRHSGRISYVTARFVAHARSRKAIHRLLTTAFGHRIEPGLDIGPTGLVAAPGHLEAVSDSLTAIIRMADLANRYNKSISPETWDAIRRVSPRLPERPSREACHHFLCLLDHSTQLAPLLCDLHGIGALERFVPALARARGLLQFNQYHKYTVDEHCLRAVAFAAKLLFDMGLLGRTYRAIASKRVLHLALLLHDLGKGLDEDHSEAGRKIAMQTAQTLELSAHNTEMLAFLVHNHLLMNHVAFRRDASDQDLVISFARDVGSPELLKMLFVLTAADLAAVGPGVWDGWKSEIVADLYHRTMQHLAGEGRSSEPENVSRQRKAVLAELGGLASDSQLVARLDALPADYVLAAEPKQVASDLRLLRHVEPGDAIANGRYMEQTDTVEYTIATHEGTAPGAFHRLAGALTSHGLEIRSAQIHTLAGGLILDRFWVRDLDCAGEPPQQRINEVNAALVQWLRSPGDATPVFRQRRRIDAHRHAMVATAPTRVTADNTTSDRYTVLDVFTHDRLGLLHAIARAIFGLGLSVWRARINTYGDRVVNVFYVTDQQGGKIEDDRQLEQIQDRLVKQIDSFGEAQQQAKR